jgi:hypothetical protein
MSTPIPPGPPPSPLSPRGRQEKDEKEEKRQEKDEKQREEKWRRDPLGALVWAFIIIWAGVVLLLNNLGLFPFIPGFAFRDWSLIFAGAGVIILIEVFIRLVMPQYRKGVIGNLILAFIFLAIGLGDTVGPGLLGGILLIGIGAAMLLGGFLRR